MEELSDLKKYKIETFYLAVSLADRYLAKLARIEKEAPCLVTLSTTCTFMAAKLE